MSSFRSKPSITGFTLIEIMIALLIGAVLIAGVIQVFITSKQSYRMQESLSRLQESGRFALDFLDRDIRMSGYRGCASKSSVPITNRLTNANAYAFSFSNGIQGFDAGTSSWLPAHSSSTTGITSPLVGSDIMTIRRAGDDSVPIVSGGTKRTSLKISRNTMPGLQNCDVVMVSDCTTADIFQVSDWNAANKLVKYETANCTTQPAGGNSSKLDSEYINGGNLHKAITTSYYVKTNANGQEALFRIINTNISPQEEELVEGVEKMQIYYGLDTDTDHLANAYVKADAVTDWSKVVSVRISLLLKTIEDNIASKPLKYSYDGNNNIQATDHRIRRVFTTTIAIRNKLP